MLPVVAHSRRRCIRDAVCVDAFYILVPLNYDCPLIDFEHAERSERWAFELTGLRHSVGWLTRYMSEVQGISKCHRF